METVASPVRTATRILDGRRLAEEILLHELAPRVEVLKRRSITPTVGILLAGEHPASVVYVRNKERTAARLGIETAVARFPTSVSLAEVEGVLAQWNADPGMHGIIAQLPLPEHLAAADLVAEIAPPKDVDCLHPENVGLLARGTPRFLPPTPAAIQQLLLRGGIPLDGQHVVIVGRSALVGKPLALMLLRKHPEANATVTVCHTGTKDLREITRSADILVAAVGRPRFITAEHVKPGAVIVAVGMSKTPEGWIGDVEEESVGAVASALTPVPGGVGPMTVAMLLSNVVQAAERAGQHAVPSVSPAISVLQRAGDAAGGSPVEPQQRAPASAARAMRSDGGQPRQDPPA